MWVHNSVVQHYASQRSFAIVDWLQRDIDHPVFPPGGLTPHLTLQTFSGTISCDSNPLQRSIELVNGNTDQAFAAAYGSKSLTS